MFIVFTIRLRKRLRRPLRVQRLSRQIAMRVTVAFFYKRACQRQLFSIAREQRSRSYIISCNKNRSAVTATVAIGISYFTTRLKTRSFFFHKDLHFQAIRALHAVHIYFFVIPNFPVASNTRLFWMISWINWPSGHQKFKRNNEHHFASSSLRKKRTETPTSPFEKVLKVESARHQPMSPSTIYFP